MLKREVESKVERAISLLKKEKEDVLSEVEVSELDIGVEYPREKDHGDYSSGVAMKVAGGVERSPMEIARELVKKIKEDKEFGKMFKEVKAEVPGFINFFVSDDYLQKEVKEVLKQKEKYGSLNIGGGEKVNVEFISANPTGPLTLGNGRGGFCGDTLSNVLEKAGFKVEREYYVNDVGVQIEKLGHSVLQTPEAVYQGDYITGISGKITEDKVEEAGKKAADIILKEYIRPTVEKMGVEFDVWKRESELLKDREKIIEELKKEKLTYKKDGALWFKSSEFGDDKDRVLVKEDGERTYFASDIAYLKDKFGRGFGKLVYFLGADHYGYVDRMKAVAEALGYDKKQVHFILMQLVRLFEGEKEVKMSKRAGTYITIDELLDEIDVDVARFFFLSRSPETHLNFDMELAKERSDKNPVYYVEYAHARICSILKKAKVKPSKKNLDLLSHESELDLMKEIVKLPEIVGDISRDYGLQRLPRYAIELARSFHQFYRDCQVISNDKKLTGARLSLVGAAKIVLKNTLELMGIEAPEKM